MKSDIKLQILVLLDLSAEWGLRPIAGQKNTWLLRLLVILTMVFLLIFGH